jgi:poly(A) polymerase
MTQGQRQFAKDLVERLSQAGYEACWAGGSVRDSIMGAEPKDYDVATSATPEEVQEVFGPKRTVPVGAAFGVVLVLGPGGLDPIEVATFRRDATYSDGRHPDHVTYSSAEEDARRRDFTINGLFYDPIAEQLIDHVGGQADLEARVIRAIGDPYERFEEDKLRLLRAVRFAATFDFKIEPKTFEAVCKQADQISVVSVERIAAELERMLVCPRRSEAIRLLIETGLAKVVLPELFDLPETALESTFDRTELLVEPTFPTALAGLLAGLVDLGGASLNGVEAVCRRLKLSGATIDRTLWLIKNIDALDGASDQPWSVLQPVLIDPGIEELFVLADACSMSEGHGPCESVAFCRECMNRPRVELDPPRLINGRDLGRLSIPQGPEYARLLRAVRDAQLDGQIATRAEALEFIRQLADQK